MVAMNWLKLSVVIAALVVVVSEAAPGRKNRGKNNDAGGWSDNNKNVNKNLFNNNNNPGSGGYKKKGGHLKTLKKAAVIGAAAYTGYQIGKLTGRFSSWGGYGNRGWGFSDWNRWREIDGFMCRDDSDCTWIDPKLDCQDYELDFQPSALWFGGDVARIVGECACPRNMAWNDRELQCESDLFLGLTATLLTVVIVLAVLITFCCCVCGFLIFRRFF